MRFIHAFLLCAGLALPAQAEILTLPSPHVFDTTLARVESAVERQGMVRIATASASRTAAGAGFAIPGDAVVLVFRNDFARRILGARPEAGIEAPLILHIRETPGGATIAWKRPSAVYAPYRHAAIDEAARELDAIFAAIAAQAAAP